ncbi:MAG: histidine kinase, partial [Acidimicrobiia bacterium]|nr:histidine kinase [Acidimicrobiia bacterium]
MTDRIEPGVVRLLRWYVGIRLAFLILILIGNRSDSPPVPPQFPRAGILLFGLLFLILILPQGERRLGRAFLPIAIALATIAPILDAAATVNGRLNAGLSPNEALADYWLPFFLLFVPFILTAWQYRYRWILVFTVASTVADLVVIGTVFRGYDVDLAVLGALILARAFLFAFIGLFVSKLVARQREAHLALMNHASTLEQLATGRERNRLARELHDTLAHSMTATAIQLEAVQALWEEDPEQARQLLDRALSGTRTGLAEARRAIEDLRASPLEEHGLAGAIEWLAEDLSAISGIEIVTSIDGQTKHVGETLEQATYRIVDESL